VVAVAMPDMDNVSQSPMAKRRGSGGFFISLILSEMTSSKQYYGGTCDRDISEVHPECQTYTVRCAEIGEMDSGFVVPGLRAHATGMASRTCRVAQTCVAYSSLGRSHTSAMSPGPWLSCYSS
jgi:hypothetical protein